VGQQTAKIIQTKRQRRPAFPAWSGSIYPCRRAGTCPSTHDQRRAPGRKAAHTSEVAALRECADAAELSRVATQVIADKAIAQLAEATVRAEQAAANERAQMIGSATSWRRCRSSSRTAEAAAKAAHDRAWVSGEQQAAANRRADVERAHVDRLNGPMWIG
jgi:hypothetical protein